MDIDKLAAAVSNYAKEYAEACALCSNIKIELDVTLDALVDAKLDEKEALACLESARAELRDAMFLQEVKS